MRVLITGATGFIGRLLVPRLISAGIEPVGLALQNDIAQYESRADKEPRLTLLPADLRDAALTAGVVAQIRPDRIIHLAAAGVTNPAIDSSLAVEHNVLGTINLIRAAFQNPKLANPAGQLIVIRTPGESHPANAYTASKAAAWSFCQMYARRHGWPIAGAMIFQAYGPHQPAHTFVQAAFRSALAGEDFDMSSGAQGRDWIYVDDVVEGLAAASAAGLPPGVSIDLGTGRRTSLLDVANMAYRLVGRGGAPNPGAIPDRSGEEISRVADVDHSASLIDWRPRVELLAGLRSVLESLGP
jgi:UDP-glucose 4-epimerase